MTAVAGLVLIIAGLGLMLFGVSPRPNKAVAPISAETMAEPSPAIHCAPPLVTMGMTKDALMAACGKPKSVNHQVIDSGSTDREQWVYEGSYVYLTNGVVDAMQYAENGEKFTWGRI